MVPVRRTNDSLRRIGVVLIAVVALAPAAFAGDADATARSFVRALSDQAIHLLTRRDMPATERTEAFQTLFAANFDVPAIGKSALGRYWRLASKDEQEEYLALFEDFVVRTYTQRLRDYTNEHLDITEAKPIADDDGAMMVHSLIVRDQPKPIRVDWRLAPAGGSFKVVDVSVEGVSMLQTQRSEFSSVIVRGGGKVAALITELKLKNQSLRAQMN